MNSLALCTWNGSKYLPEQLGSIIGQTRPVEEIVVGDDQSSDQTREILEELIRSNSDKVRVTYNAERLGSTKNFSEAISRCHGEIIFLSDQDDVWRVDKVETICRVFETRPEVGFVFSDAEIVDDQLRPSGSFLWEAVKFDRRRRKMLSTEEGWKVLLKSWVVTGATMAFRAKYRDLILPIPQTWVHDAWIALLIRSVSSCCAIDEPLIKYRQHASQQIGERRRNWLDEYRVASRMSVETFVRLHEMFSQLRRRLDERPQYAPDPLFLKELDEKIEHLQCRIDMRTRGSRILRSVAELWRGRYQRYSQGWKAFLQDVLIR
ncbi:glycosyltransferase family 2 protein [Lacunimicrobium album]